jgi:hypothetical protein
MRDIIIGERNLVPNDKLLFTDVVLNLELQVLFTGIPVIESAHSTCNFKSCLALVLTNLNAFFFSQ